VKKSVVITVLTGVLFVLYFFALIILINEKRNYHMDEVLTFVLANDTYDEDIIVAPDWYKKYDNPKEVYLDRITVQEGRRFDFRNVWKKQSMDSHPPFYYVLINIVSSFMVGKYSKWIGGSVNILIGIISLIFYRLLVKKLICDDIFVLISSAAFAFSAGILSSATYFRMYFMTMMFVLIISYIMVNGIYKRDIWFYVSLLLCSFGGTLTHYYFLLYLLPICVAFGVFLIIKKQWKHVWCFVGTMIVSGTVVYAVFPAIIRQSVGGGYRGNEVINNFKTSDFMYMIKQCFNIVNKQIAGGLMLYCLAGAFIIFIVSIVLKRKKTDVKVEFEKIYVWILLVFACVVYFALVSKITIYIVDRYFFPIYGVLILLFTSAIYGALKSMTGKRVGYIILSAVLLVTTFKEFKNSFYYLYRATQPLIDTAKELGESDSIFVFEEVLQITPAMLEVSEYNSVTFVPYYDMQGLKDIDVDIDKGLIVVLGNGCDINEVADIVYSGHEELKGYTYIGGHSTTTSYYFYTD